MQFANNNNIKQIKVDDMSDNFMKPNNIYLKNGFTYISKYELEMLLNL